MLAVLLVLVIYLIQKVFHLARRIDEQNEKAQDLWSHRVQDLAHVSASPSIPIRPRVQPDRSAEPEPQTPPPPVPAHAQSTFEAFLAEDPSRTQMLKSEQSAAYRQWRKERGMTWQ